MPDVFGASGQFSIDALNNQAQNNINNLYTGGGFGAQTNYYSGLGAQYSAAGMSPYGVFSDTGGPAAQSPISYGGGYNPGNQGGGALSVNDPSINWSQFSQPSMGNFTSPSNNYNTFQGAGDYGAGMFGGLLGSSGAYQGPSNTIDWSNLFGSGGGGASQPSASSFGAGMFGGLTGSSGAYQGPVSQAPPAVDWSNFQSPSNSYNTFQGAGGSTPESAPQAQVQQPYDFSNAPKLPDAQKLVGYDPSKGPTASPFGPPAPDQGMNPDYWANTLGGGDQSPAPQATGTRTYDFAPMFKSGGGGEFGAGGGDVSGTGDVKAGSLGGNAFSYNPYATEGQGGSVNQSADKLAEQARARLADLISGAPDKAATETAKAVEDSPTGQPGESAREAGGPATSDAVTGDIPLPQARPAGADALRPPADVPQFPAARLAPNGEAPLAFIVHHTAGRGDPASVVADWKATRPGVGSQYIMDRDGVVHDTLKEFGYGGTGHIHPDFSGDNSGIQGAQGLKNANTVGMEIVAKNDADMTASQIASLKQFAAQNYPDTAFYGHSEVSSNRTNEGLRGSQDVLDQTIAAGKGWPSSSFDWNTAAGPAADQSGAAARAKLAEAFGGGNDSKEMQKYATYINGITQDTGIPANTKFNLMSAAFDTRGEILNDQMRGFIADRNWPAIDAAANSRLVGKENTGIQFGNAGEQPVYRLLPGSENEPPADTPRAQDSPEVAGALQALANRFDIPPESIPAVLGLESNWNPQAVSKNQQNFGVAQMARDDFKTAGGTLGGMTFEQYQRAPLAKQIAAYGDFIASSPKSAYLDYASGDPALTSAILQAIQFSPQKLGGDWSDALLAGNTGVPIARNQASELGNTSVDAMRAAFAKRIAGAG